MKLRELEEEMSVAATYVECNYYEWAEDHGCLVYVIGVNRYEALTGLDFEEPSRPTRHIQILTMTRRWRSMQTSKQKMMRTSKRGIPYKMHSRDSPQTCVT